MTISSQNRKAGPFTGNGSTVDFPFTFKCFSSADLRVVLTNSAGVETDLTLTSQYTVALNADQNTSAGGTVTTLTAYSSSYKITIVGDVEYTQETDITNGGGFYPEVIESALDKVTMQIQQVNEKADRAVKVDVSSGVSPEDYLTTVEGYKTAAAASASAAAASESSALTAKANAETAEANAETAEANAETAEVNAEAAQAAAESARDAAVIAKNAAQTAETNAETAETNAAASAILANDWAAKTSGAVAGGEYSAKYHAQSAASSATDAQTAETNAETAQTAAEAAKSAAEAARDQTLTAFDNFDDRYLGTKLSDPLVDNDGNALVGGALYFNSTDGIMKVYTGSAWVAAYASLSGALLANNNLSDLNNTDTSLTNLGGTTLGKLIFKAATILAAQQSLDLEVGVDVQAYDANLTPLSNKGIFYKTDSTIVAFSKTGNFTMQTAQAIKVEVNGSLKEIAASTSITMPASPAAGTDYAIWAKTDGTLEATSNFTSPPTANARKVGGFHYAAGGNASAQAGGNTTAQINEYSIWDLKFRPVATDPRGMALVAGGFWMDIYLTGVDAITNGSSKYNVTVGDGSSPPKVPTMFGGNGSTTYGSYTWFEAAELASSFQKRLPTQRELMAAAYGTTEATASGGSDVPTTGVTGTGATSTWEKFTSKWGIIQSTGCMWIWGDDRGGPYGAASWNANTEGRGSEYNAPNAVLLGGAWNDGARCGSRCSYWFAAASVSDASFGSRFACDHLQLD